MMRAVGEEEWRIGRAQAACVRCSAPFAPGVALQSGIFRQDEDFERRDYCLACWPEAGESAFASWRTRAQSAEVVEKKPSVDPPLLIDFLRRLVETGEPGDRPLAYCLSLYLSRRKLLVLQGNERSASEVVLTYSLRDEPEVRLAITEPPLTQDDLEKAERTLLRLIGVAPPEEPGPRAEESTEGAS